MSITRSIKVKLIVPRDASLEARQLREGLWATHLFVNDGCHYYERLLLEFRQRDVCVGKDDAGKDVIVPAAEWADRLRARLGRNGMVPSHIEAALPIFRELYENMVPSALKAKSGTGQAGRSWHSKLVSPTSRGGEASAARIDVLRPLLPVSGDDPAFEPAARALIEEAGDELLTSTGRCPAWVTAYRKGPEGSAWVEKLRIQLREAVEAGDFDPPSDPQILAAGAVPAAPPLGAGIDALRPLLPLLGGDPAFEPAARALVEDIGDELFTSTGRPPTWVTAHPTWVRAHRKDAECLEAADDFKWVERLRQRLRDDAKAGKFEQPLHERLGALGALPVAKPIGAGRVVSRADLTVFERGAMELAIEHLIGWESAGHRARAQYVERKKRHDDLLQWIEAEAPDALLAVRAYEAARTIHLATLGELGAAPQYTLRLREIRPWRKLREWLLQNPDATIDERRRRLATMQTNDPRGYGGEALAWLAAPERRALVEHPAGDVVTRIAVLNIRKSILDRSRLFPTCTLADPVEHPRFAKFGKPGDKNSAGYALAVDGVRREAIIKILVPRQDGLLVPTDLRVPFAPSGQMRDLRASGLDISYERQDGRGRQAAKLQGGNLMFDRTHFARCGAPGPEALGSVWIKVALDLSSPAASLAMKTATPVRTYLSTAVRGRPESTKYEKAAPPEGFRVLSVHMGLRTAATASMLRFGAPEEGGHEVPVSGLAGETLVAFHERTVTMKLPGEDPDTRTEANRGVAKRELRGLGRGIGCLKAIRRASASATPEDRAEALVIIETHVGQGDRHGWAPAEAVGRLDPHGDPDDWKTACAALYAAVEADLGVAISSWRKAARAGGATGMLGGKSLWAVDHLERSFRFLRSWDLRARPHDGDPRRPRPGYASKLLHHIDGVKDDRVKTTADRIVQAACGRAWIGGPTVKRGTQDVRLPGRWEQRGPRADLILLPDLTHFRFRSDRPRAENSRLMRWAHRQLAIYVRMQAEVEGILVADTGAAFTTRFDAWTGAPGVRCEPVTADHLRGIAKREDYWLARLLREGALKHLRIDPASLRVDDLVPMDHGKILVALDGVDLPGLRILDTDVNASQGLGRRYIEGHGLAYRLPGARVPRGEGEREAAVVHIKGKRLASAMGGTVVVLRASEGPGDITWTAEVYDRPQGARKALGLSLAAFNSIATAAVDDEGPAPENDDEALEEEAEEALGIATGERIVFFRDPSGAVAGGGWLEASAFWGIANRMVTDRLRELGRLG